MHKILKNVKYRLTFRKKRGINVHSYFTEGFIMTKKCLITGKTVQTGNNDNKSHKKSRRRFMPNLKYVAVWSDILGSAVGMRLTVNGLRTIEKNGGLDSYLLSKPVSRLTAEAKKIRKRLEKAQAAA